MNVKFVIAVLILVLIASCKPSRNPGLCANLKVSENGRFLSNVNGDPFFWLGDTGWLLFTKLNREEAEKYFNNRHQKGFNVIQVMLIHDLRNAVNVYGDSALINQQLDQPLITNGNSKNDSLQYDYWDHVEYLVDLANEKGMYMALVPVWGSNIKSGKVTIKQAEAYATFLAERFGEKPNVIWLNGGDVKGSDSTSIWNAIGNTLRQECPQQLITFHPFGRTQSSTWFHNENWLDFNLFQSGHRRYDQDTSGLAFGEDNYKYAIADYAKVPAKPTLDGEPSYEAIPQGLHDTTQPYWTDTDLRRYAYWSVFAGGCGFTYGHNAIMQFHNTTDKNPAYGVKETWEQALDAPGASQMIYLKQLMLSESYFDRMPAQDLIAETQGEKYDYIAATKGLNFALIYTCNGSTFSINTEKLSFTNIKALWFNPRSGEYSDAGTFQSGTSVVFDPPGEKQTGNDWVLVLEKQQVHNNSNYLRERISINNDWSFFKYDSVSQADNLIYDVRPEISDNAEYKVADAKPTDALQIEAKQEVLKPWILPSGNDFIKNDQNKHLRPEGNPGSDFAFVQSTFDDRSWEKVNLPHDWAIKGPFQTGENAEVGGGMGRLPVNGVAWYRKKLDIPASDEGKSIFLDVDGAMSYAMVWLNGNLVGGWPYGYASWRLDLTPYMKPGGENQLSMRLDNPNNSARWYPGAGIYRNVWLVKTNPVHLAQFGSYLTTSNISSESANINLALSIDNNSKEDATVEVNTVIYGLDSKGNKSGKAVASFTSKNASIISEGNTIVEGTVVLKNPRLWGPPPTQQPNLYVAVSTITQNGQPIDEYETRFGIRSIEFNPDKGIFVNGERIQIKGVNNHHDLGALGAAFNTRAAERQLEILSNMGCNAIRMAHNPPAPELLELTDRMGFLVIDEIFDSWEQKKTPLDFHLIFPDWSEPDTRAFIRRDRNCPSVIIWSFGNEVGEQYTAGAGAAVAQRLYNFVKEEDPTRPTTLAMNFAKPYMELPKVPDVIGLNYQGEGIRQDPEFEGTNRIRTAPSYDAFHEKFPKKVILSTETASAFSSRGVYLFPVASAISNPVRDGRGGDSKNYQVSSYELHAVDFGSSVDKVFGTIDKHPFVAGEFVWNGFEYLGEPTPYYEARSSYSGIIDLAGFPKDRYYLYQSHWRPDFPMVHILPHWNWPERVGQVTPVHVFTSGDEVELFLNGKSLGKKKKGEYEYRLRWDDVVYKSGELKAIAYKDGKVWAKEVVKTTGKASELKATADRSTITADGKDLSFITVQITDNEGLMVPRSNNLIEFSIEGPGEIVGTDNGDATNMVALPSHERDAFNGMALVIVRVKKEESGSVIVTAKSPGLKAAQVKITTKKE